MTRTADRIVETMQHLIQTRGFSAVSYQDIADELGIRKASIHYHFATKTELGVAVVEHYATAMADSLQAATELSAWRQLDAYLAPIRDFADTADKICLCGALAGEYLALPVEMRAVVSDFFASSQQWLEKLLKDGRRSGEFAFEGSARQQARLAFSALQGALLVKRTNGDAGQLKDVIAGLKARLKADPV